MKKLPFLLVFTLLFGLCVGQSPLPIKRILLYRNGIAQIVRSGQITSEPIRLHFHKEDLNDVLKTFIAWNPDSGSLYSTGYTSGIPVDELLNRYPFDLRQGNSGMARFLMQLKGVGMQINLNGREFAGHLASAKPQNRTMDGQTLVDDHRISILSSEGTLRSFWLSDIESLHLTDPDLNADLKTYLGILRKGIESSTVEMTIYPADSPGPVQITYIQQFPVWKTSYRLELSDSGLLQGWAQVDNSTGETWNDVDLTLISGSPISFIADLYPPLFFSRPRVPIPGMEGTAPRMFESTSKAVPVPYAADSVYGVVLDQTGTPMPGAEVTVRHMTLDEEDYEGTDESGYFVISDLLPGIHEVTVEFEGFQRWVQPVRVTSGSKIRVNPVLQLGDITEILTVSSEVARLDSMRLVPKTPIMPVAEASEIGEYFEHRFPFLITLGERESALLPFLNQQVRATPLTVIDGAPKSPTPYLGLRLENDTDVPLEPGTLTVSYEGRYLGETILNYLARGEEGLIGYGQDHEVAISKIQSARPAKTTKLIIEAGVMLFTDETVETTTYQFRNKASSDKTILLEHPLNPFRELKDTTPYETTASSYRFEIRLGPGQELTFPVDEVNSQQSSLRIEKFSEDSLSLALDGKIPDELLQRLRQVISIRSDLSDIVERRDAAENEVTAIFKDQERLRENLKALDKSDKGLRESYLSKMAEQEAKLRQLRNTIKALDERAIELEREQKSQISELAWEGNLGT